MSNSPKSRRLLWTAIIVGFIALGAAGHFMSAGNAGGLLARIHGT